MLSLYLLLICDIILFLFGLSLELKPTASAFLALSLWSRLKPSASTHGSPAGQTAIMSFSDSVEPQASSVNESSECVYWSCLSGESKLLTLLTTPLLLRRCHGNYCVSALLAHSSSLTSVKPKSQRSNRACFIQVKGEKAQP